MGFYYSSYSYNGSEERILTIGNSGPNVVFVPGLFVESNRLRALTVAIMRRVAESGCKCLLPDLPGTFESAALLHEQSSQDWAAALRAAVADRPIHVAAIRGGCLLGGGLNALSRWHFAPLSGEKMMRELFRARQASLREKGVSKTLLEIETECASEIVELAGEKLSPALSVPLKLAQPASTDKIRTIRLATDPIQADRHIDGPALWRRSEPESDAELAEILAGDIVSWITS